LSAAIPLIISSDLPTRRCSSIMKITFPTWGFTASGGYSIIAELANGLAQKGRGVLILTHANNSVIERIFRNGIMRDPKYIENARKAFGKSVEYASSLKECLGSADYLTAVDPPSKTWLH
jgi:hypothetical protein